MRRLILTLALVLGVSLAAQAGDLDPRLAAVDALATFPADFSAVYTLVHKNAQGVQDRRVVDVHRRDNRQTFLVVTKEPEASRGKAYLRIGASLWLFDPQDRQFTMTSAKDRFEASNARLSDFAGFTWAQDYRITATTQEKLGPLFCRVYDLAALRDDVAFPRTKLWLTDDGLVRKTEDFSLSGDSVRRMLIPIWQPVGDRWAPAKALILDTLKGEQTQLTITNPTTAPVADQVYTKDSLERSAR